MNYITINDIENEFNFQFTENDKFRKQLILSLFNNDNEDEIIDIVLSFKYLNNNKEINISKNIYGLYFMHKKYNFEMALNLFLQSKITYNPAIYNLSKLYYLEYISNNNLNYLKSANYYYNLALTKSCDININEMNNILIMIKDFDKLREINKQDMIKFNNIQWINYIKNNNYC